MNCIRFGERIVPHKNGPMCDHKSKIICPGKITFDRRYEKSKNAQLK